MTTPGPWVVGVSVDRSGGRPWPVFRLAALADPTPEGAEVQANARLIAAAPELLAAARALVGSPASFTPESYDEAIERLRTAIAKAERGDADYVYNANDGESGA